MTSPSSLSHAAKAATGTEKNVLGVAAMVESLAEGDDEANSLTAKRLRDVSSVLEEDIEQLVKFTSHASPAVAAWSCRMLSTNQQCGIEVEAAITKTMQLHLNVSTRQEAAKALGKLAVISDETAAALREAANDVDARLARLAQQSLAAHEHN